VTVGDFAELLLERFEVTERFLHAISDRLLGFTASGRTQGSPVERVIVMLFDIVKEPPRCRSPENLFERSIGQTANAHMSARAESIAKNTSGVRDLNNNLLVSPSAQN
jgi:hypothetical protein